MLCLTVYAEHRPSGNEDEKMHAVAQCGTATLTRHGNYKCLPSLKPICNGNMASPRLLALTLASRISLKSLLLISVSDQLQTCIYFYTNPSSEHYTACQMVLQQEGKEANIALAGIGCLGCTPMCPTVAVTFPCLELFHQIHHRQSSFSTQAMAKVLCALHNVSVTRIIKVYAKYSYRLHTSTPFANTWHQPSMFISIYSRIQVSINVALGRGDPDWHLLHGMG
jgi:hypothetical protein